MNATNISLPLTNGINKLLNETDFLLTDFLKELESEEYCAYTFKLNHNLIKFRKAKITPTKIGQFVTIWKRNQKGITEPHDSNDPFDFYVIETQKDNRCGLFIFPKEILLEQKILSTREREGKRGFRVYPPWDMTINNQAIKTQAWQQKYFLETTEKIDLQCCQLLLL